MRGKGFYAGLSSLPGTGLTSREGAMEALAGALRAYSSTEEGFNCAAVRTRTAASFLAPCRSSLTHSGRSFSSAPAAWQRWAGHMLS